MSLRKKMEAACTYILNWIDSAEKLLQWVIFYLYCMMGYFWMGYAPLFIECVTQQETRGSFLFDYIVALLSLAGILWLSLVYYTVYREEKPFPYRYWVITVFLILVPIFDAVM